MQQLSPAAAPHFDATLPSGRAFQRRFFLEASAFAVAAAALLLALMIELMQLPPEQLLGLWKALGLTVAVFAPFIHVAQNRVAKPVVVCLTAIEAGGADRETLRSGFAAIVSMPRRMLIFGYATFQGCTTSAAVLMLFWFQDFQIHDACFLILVGATGGTLPVLAEGLFLKLRFASVRDALAARLPDPAERAALVRRMPLGFKLHATLLATGLAPLVFSVFMTYGRSLEPLGDLLDEQQDRALARIEQALLDGGGLDAVSEVESEASAWAIPIQILAVDLVSGVQAIGDEDALSPEEWRRLDGDEQASAEGPIGSLHRYRHRDLEELSLRLVAVSPKAGFFEIEGMLGGFALLALVSGVSALLLARFSSRDIADSVAALRREAERLASGDLREGLPVESDDELGDLGRAYSLMAGSLRETVSRVSDAADHIDESAGSLGTISGAVGAVARSQVEGMRRASEAMGGVSRGVGHITGNAEELHRLMEESSSSILEMGAAGEQLLGTARGVSTRVTAMSSAVGSMASSVQRVGASTGSLASAASETSESMEEMASAMLQVDTTAKQTVALSEAVVKAAEAGQAKVREAIEGMSSIASATDAAEAVIRGLDNRAREIGSILDVIDGVADETGLLALNAAIIAAQAGEQGRAFSVVADQIKELAGRVLSSTKEIAAQIEAVQSESRKAIGAIEEGSRNVSRGVDTSSEAGLALEQITESARQSGQRTQDIMQAVRAQTEAASRVTELMARVSRGVDEIRRSTSDQTRGNQEVADTAEALRDAADQLERSTGEQSRGALRLREHVEGVRSVAEGIRDALASQSAACSETSAVIGSVAQQSSENEAAADRVAKLNESLRSQAERLREQIARFRLG